MASKEKIHIDIDGLLNEKQLSEFIDLPVRTILKYVESGYLPGRRIGPPGAKVRILVSVKELIAFAEEKVEKGGK